MSKDYAIKKLTKALERAERKAADLEQRFAGREAEHTFHGGWSQGYWEGRASGLEFALYFLEREDETWVS